MKKKATTKRKMNPPLIKGKGAKTNPGFQENISRERAKGKPMKQAIAIAYGEADDAFKEAHRKFKKAHNLAKKHLGK